MAFSISGGLTRLKFLNLRDNIAITNAGLMHLDGTNVESLEISNTAVTDAGLAHLKGLKKLRVVWLLDCNITDAGIKHLSAVTSLKQVTLRNTQVTQAGADALKKSLPNCLILR